MRKLTTVEEIKKLETKKVVTMFDNFEEIVNGHPYSEMKMYLDPYHLHLIDFVIAAEKGNDKAEIYDMGSGYYMLINQQLFHKGVNKFLFKEGVDKEIKEYEHTTTIVRVVD